MSVVPVTVANAIFDTHGYQCFWLASEEEDFFFSRAFPLSTFNHFKKSGHKVMYCSALYILIEEYFLLLFSKIGINCFYHSIFIMFQKNLEMTV